MTSWTVLTPAGRSFMEAAAARPREVLLALDFDGTLAAIVPDPEDSRLNEAAAEAMAALVPAIGRLAIVTGRGVSTVRRLARLAERNLDGLVVAGGYGAETWIVGDEETPDPPRPRAIEVALPLVAATIEASGAVGVTVEDKGVALGIHTRRATDPEAAFRALLPALTEVAGETGLTLEPGRHVVELRATTVDKGDAIAALVAASGARVVAMCGDDLGDLPAFAELERLRGLGLTTCRVVSASAEQGVLREHADIVTDGPDGIAAWLGALAREIAAR